MRIAPEEFRKLDLRCHDVLAGVPLHDVWSIPLDGGGPGRTMEDVFRVAPLDLSSPNLAVKALFGLRRALGRLFRLDGKPGTSEGAFRTVYFLDAEALLEIRNRTVHGFLVSALIEREGGYLLYWAIYVQPVGRITGVYMALIDPFRRLIVYPALIRDVQRRWATEVRRTPRRTARPRP